MTTHQMTRRKLLATWAIGGLVAFVAMIVFYGAAILLADWLGIPFGNPPV